MRVVAGRVKGHHLQAPKGMDTRPTSDKVREAIFAVVADRVEDEDVLDLFAGTGALAIEALSRGAASAVLVEKRPAACQIIRANLRHTRLEAEAKLLCMPVERALRTLDTPFGLILLDPPYAMANLHGIMSMLSGSGVVGSTTTVVFEHSPRFAVAERYGRLALQRQKVYGDTAVSIFAVQEEQDRDGRRVSGQL
jgi:16S rRNA (guanine(966)-N(2))-methyltransferase RsmD